MGTFLSRVWPAHLALDSDVLRLYLAGPAALRCTARCLFFVLRDLQQHRMGLGRSDPTLISVIGSMFVRSSTSKHSSFKSSSQVLALNSLASILAFAPA